MKDTHDASVARRPRLLSRLFVFALVLAAVFYAVRELAPQTVGETARRTLLTQLQDHYREYDVSIRRGYFDPDVGLIFEDLRIRDPSPSGIGLRSAEMLRVERLTVVADIQPEKLLDQKLPMTTRRVVMDGVHANAWLSKDGQLSLTSLFPMPKLGPVCPLMELRRVNVRLFGSRPDRRPIDAELEEVVIVSTSCESGIVDKSIKLRGATDFANELIVQVDLREGATDVRCKLKGAFINRDLLERLPEPWSQPAQQVKDLECVCDAVLALHRSPEGQMNYQLRTTVHDGRVGHPLLPRSVSQLRGIVSVDPGGVTIESSQGMLGDAVVRVKGRIDGHRMPAPAKLTVNTRGLLLDDRLAASLPPSLQASWAKLQPLGRIDVDAELSHQSNVWKTDATLICKGVDVRYEKFPYPIENLVGRVEIRNNIASTDSLNGRIGGNRMQCAFKMPVRPGITNEKSFVIATNGPIPIDKTLLGALSPRGGPKTPLQSFVESLHPSGSVQLATALLATDVAGRTSRKIDLRVINGHLSYEKFPYPLDNVTGKIQVEDEMVTLEGFRATNVNSSTVLCDGFYRMPPKATSAKNGVKPASSNMKLHFRASDVPMDDSLRRSLPEASQQVWGAISPSGILDELTVHVGKLGAAPLELDITARQKDREQVTSRTLSLRPSALPYRMDVTGGLVHYDGNQVTIESITGKHDASSLSADGLCVRDQNGRWQLLLNLHSGSRLHPDVELISALPVQMRVAMRALQLRGPINLRGQSRFALPDAAHPDPAIQWDLVLQLEGNRIGDVGPVHSLRGELSVNGMSDELGIRADGDVRIDSMHVHDLQITRIHGPFSIEGDRLHLGSQSGDRKIAAEAKQPPSIEGMIFDGTIKLDGEVILSSGAFDVGLTVADAQVPTLLADFGQSHNELTGTFSGRTQLQGSLGTTDLLKGSGEARLTGANLYQLPLIVQVLRLLSITPTEDVAFTDGEVRFTIFGETITFSDLQLWGDLVALHGDGTLDRRRELDLTFNTRVSPQNTFTRLFRPLSSQRYTLWTIDVRGPLQSPNIERRSLDRVGEILFPGIADRDDQEPQEEPTGLGRWFK